MVIVLAILAVAFAAFCVWITVRIVNRREWWAKWTLATMLVVGWPLALIAQRDQAVRQARQQAERV
jgi:hypothetical protein